MRLKKLQCINEFRKRIWEGFSEVLEDVNLFWHTHLHIWNPEEGDWNDCWGSPVALTGLFEPNDTIEKIEKEIDKAIAPIKKYLAEEEEEEEEIKKLTLREGANREEWIEYLAKIEAVPVWDDRFRPFPIYFRRKEKPEDGGKHIEGFGKKTRQRIAEILGINTKKDCERVREEIKKTRRKKRSYWSRTF